MAAVKRCQWCGARILKDGICTGGQGKPEAEFSPNTSRPSGFQSYCRDCNRARRRRGRGISAEQAVLKPMPGERCAICSDSGGPRGLFLDHDHATGRARGWLCHGCNSAIGQFHDDPHLLERAIRYLCLEDPE